MVQFISFGGAGGCGIAEKLRKIGYVGYPFDWLVSGQSFVTNFFTKETDDFINWDAPIEGLFMIHRNINNKIDALAIHDLISSEQDRNVIKEKYRRRIERLNDVMKSNETIVFFRVGNCPVYGGDANYKNEYINFRDKENNDDEQKWVDFVETIKKMYNRNNFFLFICQDTETPNIIRKLSENVFITDQNLNIETNYILNYIKENSIYDT